MVDVASFTDAWIETLEELTYNYVRSLSHLLQMRGLKLIWKIKSGKSWRSHLLQMRGLKRGVACDDEFVFLSHLLQMRGLKLNRVEILTKDTVVASFTDAWIETGINWKSVQGYMSHLLQMRGLKQRLKADFRIR